MRCVIITQCGFSRHYGSPDSRIVLDLPEDVVLWKSPFGSGVSFALAREGITPPEWLPDRHGGMTPAKWTRLCGGLGSVARVEHILYAARMAIIDLVHPSEVREYGYTWRDLRAAHGNATRHPDNAKYWQRVVGINIRYESDPVTGPLAPLDAEQQNAVAAVVFGLGRKAGG